MKSKTTTKKTSETRQIFMPFEFRGNKNGCKVREVVPGRGDGDIYTGHGGRKYCSVRANLRMINPYTVRLQLYYYVWESNWNNRKNRDALYFIGTEDLNLKRFYKTKIDEFSNPKTEETTWFSITTPHKEFYITDFYNSGNERHGWLPLDSRSYPKENHLQSWMPVKDLFVKIDDGGRELTRVGNIGVKGCAKFTIKVYTQKKVTTYYDDDPIAHPTIKPQEGSFVTQKSISPNVSQVLGRGYDICGRYANPESTKAPILDLSKLNEYKRLEKTKRSEFEGKSVSGNGFKELSKSYENSLSIKVSGGFAGFSFSNESKSSYKEEKYNKESYKFLNIMNIFQDHYYRIEGFGLPEELNGFLSKQYLKDLENLSPADIIKKYGTHVILGMSIGARLDYKMSYKQSIASFSSTKTFSNTTSIKYDKAGEILSEKKESSNAETLFKNLANGKMKMDATTIKAITELYKSIKSKSSGGSSPNAGISASVSYSTSTSKNQKEEDNSLEIQCKTYGGKSTLARTILDDPKNYNKWIESINSGNEVWCDFLDETIIPIYEFIPQEYAKSNKIFQIKQAWKKYIKENGNPASIPLGKDKVAYSFTSKGKKKTINLGRSMGVSRDDGEICTKSGKNTGWRLELELLNIDGGKIAASVKLTVGERGLNSGRSLIQLRDVIELPRTAHERISVDTNYRTNYEWRGEIVGKHHEWIDITNIARSTPGGCDILDLYGSRLYIRIDGSGSDYGNIGVKGKFRVPVLYY